MNKHTLKQQVDPIRQAFGYINQFKDEIFVIKIASPLVTHPSFPILIADLVLLHKMGIRMILVPGTRNRINEILHTFNIEYTYVDGIRVSSEDSIPFIKMASFDVSNKVMTLLAENNTSAVIGNWVKARSIGVRNGIDFQSSGSVDAINTGVVKKLLDEGMIPIFPNIGWSLTGKPYNLSSNQLSMTIAKQLGAAKLFFVTDSNGIQAKDVTVPSGVYVSNDGIISQMTVTEAGSFIDLNSSNAKDPSVRLITCAYDACRGGVNRVHIIDGRVEGMLLKEVSSNRGYGTMIYANQHENIRLMNYRDIPFVLSIMEDAVEQDILVARSHEHLEEKIRDFFVYEVDGTIHGCGALHPFPGRTGEIAAVAVDETYTKFGIGKKIITFLIEQATNAKMKKVFVLTTQTSDWFQQLGFTEGGIDDLPEEKRKSYNPRRNSRVLIYTISTSRRSRVIDAE